MADLTFGCRKPNTIIGEWSGAFVYVKQKNIKIAALFENNNGLCE